MPVTDLVQTIDSSENSKLVPVQDIYNYHVSAAPGVTDDENDGYEVGHLWLNGATGQLYQCDDATAGAAVWSALNPSGGVVPADYTPAQTVLVAVADQTPLAQVVGSGEFVGRPSGGNIGVITAAQARVIINASSEAEFDAIADAGVIDADRMVDDTFGTAEFAAGAGGKFAAGALDAAGAANLIADGVLLPRMNLAKTIGALGAGDVSATAAQLVGGVLTVGAAAANTLTVDTAANIIANASVGATVGTSFEVVVINTAAGTSALTIAAGVTIVGDPVVAGMSSGTFLCIVTGAASVVFVRK